MSIYCEFCKETFCKDGSLKDFRLNFADNFNFGYDVVDKIAEREPEKRALVWCNEAGEEKSFTFSELASLSNRIANLFSRLGLQRGDCVLLILKRHYEYWFTMIACHKLGIVAIPATHMLTKEDLAYRIRKAKVKGVVCTPQNKVPEKISEALQEVKAPCLKMCVQHDVAGFLNLSRALEKESNVLSRRETKADDPMLMYFTSGTTGYPKGVIHNFAYPLAHIVTAKYWQQAEEDGLHFTVAETGWAKASWGKMYGQWLVGSAVMVYDFDHFDPRQLCGIINRYQVTSFCAPPTVYRYLVRKGIPPMPSLRHASTAGEKLSSDVFRKFTESTGIPLLEGFGQTETTLLIGNFKGMPPVEGSLGTASPLYHIELRSKDGEPTPVGEIGEIVVVPKDKKNVGIFSAYLEGEKMYENAWRGGVYHTGDAAYRDETGRFWFHSRFDDVIKTGGFRVGPYEVENILMDHPAVMECSVVGIPDPLRGQAIKASVVLSQGVSPSKELEEELKTFCNGRLAEYKWIRALEFVDALDKTISGKILKKTK